MKQTLVGLVLWLAGALLMAASCSPSSAPTVPAMQPSPTPDVPALRPEHVISLVADRFKTPSRGQRMARNAKAVYQEKGWWTVALQVGNTPEQVALWQVFEGDRSVFPVNDSARRWESM